MHKPTTLHFQPLKESYDTSKVHFTMAYSLRRSLTCLQAFSNSYLEGNLDDRTFTSAFIIYLGGTPIPWSSNKKKTMVRSSTKVEYKAIATIVSELTWIQSLLQELQVQMLTPPTVFYDDLSATYTCKNLVFYTMIKHLALDYFFIREKVRDGQLIMQHISTENQLLDALSKPFSKSKFHLLHPRLVSFQAPYFARAY